MFDFLDVLLITGEFQENLGVFGVWIVELSQLSFREELHLRSFVLLMV